METLRSVAKVFRAGKYIFADSGEKRPVNAAKKTMYRFKPLLKIVYGGVVGACLADSGSIASYTSRASFLEMMFRLSEETVPEGSGDKVSYSYTTCPISDSYAVST